MDFPFKSTKTWWQAFPVAYRQWKADSHCSKIHGYALTIHLEFGCLNLDVRNWTVDFGGLKDLKAQLEEWFDHTLLVAEDDPEKDYLIAMHNMKLAKVTVVAKTGCEGLSDFIFEHLNDGWLANNGYADRVICTKVEVRETDANMAFRELTKADYLKFTAGQWAGKKFPALPPRWRLHESGTSGDLYIYDEHGALAGGVNSLLPGYTPYSTSGLFLTQNAALEAEQAFLAERALASMQHALDYKD